ncbi:MAG TPA: hypothetical protein VEA59_04770 [Patescibacteria group bacterium]|nr:hypothetical protein [Patescibacteria group bacterium]
MNFIMFVVLPLVAVVLGVVVVAHLITEAQRRAGLRKEILKRLCDEHWSYEVVLLQELAILNEFKNSKDARSLLSCMYKEGVILRMGNEVRSYRRPEPERR